MKVLVTLNHLGPATDIAHVLAAGGPKAVQRHHERGKLLPRCAAANADAALLPNCAAAAVAAAIDCHTHQSFFCHRFMHVPVLF